MKMIVDDVDHKLIIVALWNVWYYIAVGKETDFSLLISIKHFVILHVLRIKKGPENHFVWTKPNHGNPSLWSLLDNLSLSLFRSLFPSLPPPLITAPCVQSMSI